MKTLKILIIVLFVLLFIVVTLISMHYFSMRETEKKQLDTAINIISTAQEDEIEIVTKEELALNNNVIGILEIPVLDLIAPVQEGTSEDILKIAIGHFSESAFWNGNVAFASHNRSQHVQYFEKINELQSGDEIIYKTKLGTRTYAVYEIKIIESTDWSVIENTNENIVTLITCINDNPSSRLCIKAKEIS